MCFSASAVQVQQAQSSTGLPKFTASSSVGSRHPLENRRQGHLPCIRIIETNQLHLCQPLWQRIDVLGSGLAQFRVS